MDNKVVVGVGNIYACEALFKAEIHPQTPSNSLTTVEHARLVPAIKSILKSAITQGGTSFRDFLKTDGKPGYFTQSLGVYGRANAPCHTCQTPISTLRLAGRNTFYCPQCQNGHFG